MVTRYWSLSQDGHLQPHSKSKAWQLVHNCNVIYTCKTEEKYQVLKGHLAKRYKKPTLLMHTWWRGGSIVVVKRAPRVGGSFFSEG